MIDLDTVTLMSIISQIQPAMKHGIEPLSEHMDDGKKFWHKKAPLYFDDRKLKKGSADKWQGDYFFPIVNFFHKFPNGEYDVGYFGENRNDYTVGVYFGDDDPRVEVIIEQDTGHVMKPIFVIEKNQFYRYD